MAPAFLALAALASHRRLQVRPSLEEAVAAAQLEQPPDTELVVSEELAVEDKAREPMAQAAQVQQIPAAVVEQPQERSQLETAVKAL